MIFGEGPIIKNIARDLNKLFLQGTRAGQPILNVEGDAAADQGTKRLLNAPDAVIDILATSGFGQTNRLWKTVYSASDLYFNYRVTDIIDTGVRLFAPDTVDRDFRINFSFHYGTDPAPAPVRIQNATIIGMAGDDITPYPGLVVRMQGTQLDKIQIVGGIDSASYVYLLTQVMDVPITISRINGVYGLVINGVEQDVSGLIVPPGPFENTVLIGGAYNANGAYFRSWGGYIHYIDIAMR